MKGIQLREAREKVELDQVAYAEELGIHPITLSRYERDRQPIPRYIELAACELARVLKAKKKSKPKK